MKIKTLDVDLTVCKLPSAVGAPTEKYCFLSVTDDEVSLVCPTELTPERTLARQDGWKAFRVVGQLDFSLVGVLANVSQALAAKGVPLFVVSTYDTDYVLVKSQDLSSAVAALVEKGWEA